MGELQALEINDFSGGMTDDLFSAEPNEFNIIRNMFVTADRFLLMRGGSVVDDTTRPYTPSGINSRIGNLISFNDQVLQRVASKLYFNDSGFTSILGPNGGDPLFGATVSTNAHFGKWNNHLFGVTTDLIAPQKFYANSNNVLQCRNASLPNLDTAPTISGAGGSTHLYAFCYEFSYTAGGTDVVEFTDFSSLQKVTHSTSSSTPTNTITIPAAIWTAIAKENIDYASVKLGVYRTKVNQVFYRKVGEAAYGASSFVDTVADSAWSSGAELYTEGGIQENMELPKCKYIHVMDAFAFYAHVKIGTETFRNRVYQSKEDDLDSTTEDNFAEVDGTITGVSSFQSNPLVFTEDAVYRLDGRITNEGQGDLRAEKISDTTGCIEHQSIVRTLIGTFFAGKDGFYVTDGYNVQKISDGLNETYARITSTATKRARIQGAWDANNERVYWAVQYTDVGTDNDAFLVFDARKGIKRRGCFTLLDGKYFGPSALLFDGSTLYRGHFQGWLFRHDGTSYTDPKIDFATTAVSWGTETIIWQLKDVCRNFGTNFIRKWVPNVQVTTKNDGNLAIQPTGYNDGDQAPRNMKPIAFRFGFYWGDQNFSWGDPNFIWNFTKVIEESRRLPAGKLRCEYFQLELTNADIILQNSDDFGLATVNPGSGEITLVNANSAWLSETDGYYIAFEHDDYAQKYKVRRRDSDSKITLTGVTGLPVAGNYKWELSGKQKGQIMHLLGYLIQFSLITSSQKTYDGNDGGNA